MTPEERAAIRDRDADAECVNPRCHQTAADRRALVTELERLHSWDGLMELLDEHWPADIFVVPTLEEVYGELYRCNKDGTYTRANPGVRITGLMRWLDNVRQERKAWERDARDQAYKADRRTDEINALTAQVDRMINERNGSKKR